jgi:fluoride exporter
MSVLVWLGLGALGGLGATARFALDGFVAARAGSSFPFGTLAVNLSGSLALGLIIGLTSNATALHLLATGLVGAYTTFSTWMFESDRLAEDGELGLGLANFVVSVVLGVAFAWLGTKIGAAL